MMMVETLILAALIAPCVWVARHRQRMLADVWQAARPWERVLLIFAALPIPGPLDELLGLLVIRRVAARVAHDVTR